MAVIIIKLGYFTVFIYISKQVACMLSLTRLHNHDHDLRHFKNSNCLYA
ncbi:CbtB-domain containing protein [Acinetobacter baumannii]|nr:CbtB-domain containing protein [Acinetobacter baumannii]